MENWSENVGLVMSTSLFRNPEVCREAATLLEKRAELAGQVEELNGQVEEIDNQLTALENGTSNGHASSVRRASASQSPKAKKAAKSTGEIATFKTGGKGRKQCSKCETFVGARVGNCVCGYNFATHRVDKSAAKSAVQPAAKSAPKSGKSGGKREAVIEILQNMPLGAHHAEVVEAFLKSGYKTSAAPASINTMISAILAELAEEHIVLRDADRRWHYAKKASRSKVA